MKYCIIYSSKTGSTKRCAALLAANLGLNNCDVFSITDKLPEITDYDFLIAGSYIRLGKADRKISSLLSKYKDEIPYAFFLCGMLDNGFAGVLKKSFGEKLVEMSICTDFFGADYKPELYHGFDSIITSALIRLEHDDDSITITKNIDPKRITAFSDEIKSYLSENEQL